MVVTEHLRMYLCGASSATLNLKPEATSPHQPKAACRNPTPNPNPKPETQDLTKTRNPKPKTQPKFETRNPKSQTPKQVHELLPPIGPNPKTPNHICQRVWNYYSKFPARQRWVILVVVNCMCVVAFVAAFRLLHKCICVVNFVPKQVHEPLGRVHGGGDSAQEGHGLYLFWGLRFRVSGLGKAWGFGIRLWAGGGKRTWG
jgi:hypothetical protein